MAAGGLDVLAFGEADGGFDAVLLQDFLEGDDFGVIRRLMGKFFDRIIGNEIDFAEHAL